MTTAVNIEPASRPSVEESADVLPAATLTSVPATAMPVGLLPTATPWPSTEAKMEAEKPTSTLPPPTATPTLESTATPTPAPTATPAALKAEVVARGLNVRSGPGTDYPKLGHLKAGQEVEVIGQDPATGWLQIVYSEAASGKGWISGKAAYVRLEGSLEAVPVVAVSEPPPPSPSPSPSPPPSSSPSAAAGGKLNGKLVFQTSSGGDIYSINADGTGLRRLTAGLDPTWSPDGGQVAFARWTFPYGLYVVNADGSGERHLFGAPQVKAPDWSPDGTRIVFTYQHEGHLEDREKCIKRSVPGSPEAIRYCFEIPADPWWKLGVVRLGDGYFYELHSHNFSYSPTWSPDGTRIAYASDKGLALTWEGATSEVTRDPNVGALSQKWTLDRSPAWSPDGTRLAFQYWSHDHYEIMVMNADGSGRTLLTESPALTDPALNSVSPAWSPDGQHIVYLTDARGRWELFVMNAAGSDQRPVLEEALNDLTFEYHNVDERVVDWGP
jgi:TolB protein